MGQKFKLEHAYDDDPKMSRSSSDSSKDSHSAPVGESGIPDEEDYLKLLETPAEKKARKRSHWVAHAMMMLMTVGFSIILSGTWPYLVALAGGEDKVEKTALGWVIAANPLGQLVASPLMGYLANKFKRIRELCYVTVILTILANALYGALPWINEASPDIYYPLMIVSRLLVGIGSGNITLSRSYIAGATTVKERTKGIAMVSAAQAVGLVIGPAIQAVLALIIDEDIWKYASVGWVMVALGIVNLVILTPFFFTEYNIAEKERAYLSSLNPEKDVKLPKPDYIPMIVILFGFFMMQFIYVLSETLMEPLVEDQFGWCADIAVVFVGICFSFAGILSVCMFIAAVWLAKRFDERRIMIFCAFIPLIIGLFCFFPWGDNNLTYCEDGLYATTTILPHTYSTTLPPTSTMLPPFLHEDPSGSLVYEGQNRSKLLLQSDNYAHPLLLSRSRRSASIDDANKPPPVAYGFMDDLVEDNCDEKCLGCPDEQDWCDGYPAINLTQFIIGYVFVFVGFPFGVGMSNAIYSKILGPRPQGTWMGILTASGSVARIVGPVFVSYVYTNFGTRLNFGIIEIGMIIALITVIVFYKRLVPLKMPEVDNENERY